MKIKEMTNPSNSALYFGHSGSKSDQWQTLKGHIEGVTRRVSAALDGWYGHDEAVLAALLHDLGKYTESFQRRLHGLEKGLDHWSAGALACLVRYQSLAAALAVYGHHVGIPSLDFLKTKKTMQDFPATPRVSSADLEQQLRAFEEDALVTPVVANKIYSKENFTKFNYIGCQMEVRRLFSALVDADFLDTEEHFKEEARTEGGRIEPERDLQSLLRLRQSVGADSRAATGINGVREEVFQACLEAAECKPGIFTLTAPTGAGKTLAMLAFAQKHCHLHGKRRIITVLPFLTLLEQTVGIYRRLLPDGETLIEHHSLAEYETRHSSIEDGQSVSGMRLRQLTENWDAPYVITTNVQFFESLFAHRPGKCRKLHRIADSVILLDEVQTLPRKLAVPTLATLSHLAQYWGCTIVLATATQPAFSELASKVAEIHPGGWRPVPIIPNPQSHFEILRRTRYEFRQGSISAAELAEEVATESSALIVVNLKRQARDIWGELQARGANAYHLSTSMCPEHRSKVLAEIRLRLKERKPTVLVSTQCVEAGVDLDFPRLYRAYAPWDSMVQAAGRCNREGLNEVGRVTLFEPEGEGFPDGTYRQATEVARKLLRRNPSAHLDDPALVNQYFRHLYKVSELNHQELEEAIRSSNFEQVARLYRLIADDCINVLAPYPPALEKFEQLQQQSSAAHRRWFKEARKLTVAVYPPDREKPIWQWLAPVLSAHSSEPLHDWHIYTNPLHYHPELGLLPPDQFEDLIF